MAARSHADAQPPSLPLCDGQPRVATSTSNPLHTRLVLSPDGWPREGNFPGPPVWS